MQVIVDTNIIFSALLSKDSAIREVLLKKEYEFYAPNFVVVELFRHKARIIANAKCSEAEIYETLTAILEHVRFVEESFISTENREKAFDLCADIDENDSVFVALALESEGLLWTGDKKLREGLEAKGFRSFFK